MQSIAVNKKAKQNYQVLESLEAGLVLSGPEVKSCKKGSVDFKGSFINLDKNMEAWLENFYIAPYKPAKNVQKKYNPEKSRKLLLSKKELRYLTGKQTQKGISLVPLEVYLKNRIVKLKIGVVKGMKKYDKREQQKKKEFERRTRKSFAV